MNRQILLVIVLWSALTALALTADQGSDIQAEAENLQKLMDQDPEFITKPVGVQGNTPLHLAVDSDNTAMVQLLLEKGASITQRNKAGDTPLHLAASKGNPELVSILLATPGSSPDLRDDLGRTPLHITDSVEIAELLITKGANVNATDNFGNTPLHFCGDNEIAVLTLLLEKGADVNARNIIGETPLHTVIQPTSTQLDIIQTLIEYGADPNALDYGGLTPLHLSAIFRKPRILQRLLDNGADLNARCYAGKTAIFYAVQEKTHRPVVEVLLKAGANLTIRDNDGLSAEDVAQPTSGLKFLIKDPLPSQAAPKESRTLEEQAKKKEPVEP